jgi:heat shock protein HtpX
MNRGFLPLAAMVAVVALCGWIIGGLAGIALAAVLMLVLAATMPRLSPHAAMRLHGAVPVHPTLAPAVYRELARLARRARLPRLPQLYRLPSPAPAAFAVGDPDGAAVAVSDGLVRLLDGRELSGVLAHEVAHIAAGDLAFSRLGDVLQRATAMVCMLGLLSALLLMAVVPGLEMPLLAVWTLALAPSAIGLLRLALSRSREFAADAAAAELTGDPAGLARALHKLDLAERWTLRHLFGRMAGLEQPSCLRTHPATRDRIARLLQGGGAGRAA